MLGLSLSLFLATAPLKLGVLSVSSPAELQAIGSEITLLMEDTARSSGYDVIRSQALRDSMGEDAYAAAQGCLSKVDCLARRLQGHAIGRVVTGKLERDEARYRLQLFLVQLDPPALLASAEKDVPIASRRFAQEVSELIPRLLQGEKEPLGTLHLDAGEKDVQVEVDGVPVGTLPVTLHPRPGKHLVRATKEKHLPVERWVTVSPSKESKVKLQMTLAPGQLPEDEAPGIEVAHQGKGVWLGRPWPFWVAAGATALSAAAAGGFALDASQRARRVEQSFDPATQTYREPRTEALRGQQSAKLANTFLIVAGAAALTTGVLTFVLPAGGGTAAPHAYVSPMPGQLSAGISGRF